MDFIRQNIAILIIIFIAFILFSCEQETNTPSISYINQLNGKWIIEESLSTNGPVCYFLDKGNEISFEVNETENGLFFHYFTGDFTRHDYFTYIIEGKRISGKGNYSTSDLPELLVDTTLIQFLDIEFLNLNRIHCKLRLQVFSPLTGELVIGDVSNFYATKPKLTTK